MIEYRFFKIGVGWFGPLGVRKYLKERWLHFPEKALAGWCEVISKLLPSREAVWHKALMDEGIVVDLDTWAKVVNKVGPSMVPEVWREIEENVVKVFYDGVLIKMEDK